MKVRITDLLDTYYDNTVKLDPQPSLGQPFDRSFPPEKPREHRMRKPMLIVATLLLVVTSAAALALGFQRLSLGGQSGNALAEGAAPSPVQEEFGAAAATASAREEEIMPEATVTASAVEDGGQAVPFLLCTLPSYTQQGKDLTFTLCLENVPREITQFALYGADEASAALLESGTLEDMTAQALGEGWEETGQRYLLGHVTMSGQVDALNFNVRMSSEDGSLSYWSQEASVPYSSLDTYIQWDAAGIYEYSMEVPSDLSAKVTRMIVQEQVLRFAIQVPAESMSPEDLEQLASDWANTLVSLTQSDLLQITMRDGSMADLTAEDYTCYLDGGVDNGEFSASLVITLVNPIDPLEIDYVTFVSQSIIPDAESEDAVDISAEDPDGDGVLTAELDLYSTTEVRQSPVSLTKFTIDLETGRYAWHFTHPQLAMALAALPSEEDWELVLKDEAYIAVSNALIEDFFQTAYLVLTDGTKLEIGDGNLSDYVEGELLSWDHIAILAEGRDTLSIDHLEINGVAFALA